MKRAHRLLAVALVGAAVLASAAGSAGQDSPWPRTDAVPANVRAIKSVVRDLSRKLELMELSAARYADWEACIRGVPVSEYGDPDRQWGYLYDERNGIGTSYMPALAVDRKGRPRREDYLFLDFSRSGNCRSNAPLPGGTADPASVQTTAAASRRPRRQTLRHTLRNLERGVRNLKRSARRLLAASERFDEWESCVSWVPVTEYGDPDGRFGYLFGARDAFPAGYRPGLAIDRSDWDDPDYMFLAFVGGDRPGRTCQDEPGEALDLVLVRPGASAEDPSTVRDRVEELQQELDSLTEEIEDLREPVAEFDLFDECMYLIGVSEYGRADGSFGFLFGQGGATRRPGLALDIRGFGIPQYQFLAFPAEEPPSIECNEDAGQELIDN